MSYIIGHRFGPDVADRMRVYTGRLLEKENASYRMSNWSEECSDDDEEAPTPLILSFRSKTHRESAAAANEVAVTTPPLASSLTPGAAYFRENNLWENAEIEDLFWLVRSLLSEVEDTGCGGGDHLASSFNYALVYRQFSTKANLCHKIEAGGPPVAVAAFGEGVNHRCVFWEKKNTFAEENNGAYYRREFNLEHGDIIYVPTSETWEGVISTPPPPPPPPPQPTFGAAAIRKSKPSMMIVFTNWETPHTFSPLRRQLTYNGIQC